jgi:hypothetical protein
MVSLSFRDDYFTINQQGLSRPGLGEKTAPRIWSDPEEKELSPWCLIRMAPLYIVVSKRRYGGEGVNTS